MKLSRTTTAVLLLVGCGALTLRAQKPADPLPRDAQPFQNEAPETTADRTLQDSPESSSYDDLPSDTEEEEILLDLPAPGSIPPEMPPVDSLPPSDVPPSPGAARQVPALPEPSQPPAAVESARLENVSAREVRIFHLKYADADSTATIASQLFGGLTIVTDQRLNALVVSGSQGDLAQLETVLAKLDQPQRGESSHLPAQYNRQMSPGPKFAGTVVRHDLLRGEYRRLEREAARLAADHRDLPLKADRSSEDATALKKELVDVVARAFVARQELRKAELVALRQRLARVERQMAARERIRDTIIERRVEELLDPALRWEGDALVDRAHKPVTAHGAGTMVVPPSLGQVADAIDQLEKERQHLSKKYAPQHPQIRQIEADLQALRSTAKNRRAALSSKRAPTPPTLQGAADLGRRLNDAGAELNRMSQLQEKGLQGAIAVEFARRTLAVMQMQLDAQLRLLQVQIQQSELGYSAARKKLALASSANRTAPETVSESDLESLKHDADVARLEVERAKTLHELYQNMKKPISPELY